MHEGLHLFDDQVRAGEERVMPGWQLDAACCSVRMKALQLNRGASVLPADDVCREARQRQPDSFGELLRVRPDEANTDTLARAWSVITGPDGQPYLRMFSQLRENAEQSLWPGFRRLATTDWLEPLENGLRSIDRPRSATLVLAVIRGLLMDLDATGDTARTDQAFHELLATLVQPLTSTTA